MNLYLLVEGRQTERRVYREWLAHAMPPLKEVNRIQDLVADNFLIISGGGYPSCLDRIRGTLRDIRDHEHPVDHYLVCIDAEEDPYEQRLAAVQQVVTETALREGVLSRHPGLGLHVIVQNCCIETWFLGHARMLKRNPDSATLAAWKRQFDVSLDDPEDLPALDGYITRASFHLAYLKEMLAEHGKRYSKEHPGVVTERGYLQALRERCTTTGHLRSLNRLFGVLHECDASLP